MYDSTSHMTPGYWFQYQVPADAARLIDDADPLDAGLAEVGARQHPGDAAADDQDVDLVVDRVAVASWRERVVAVPGEVGVVLQVTDLGPAFDQPVVAFGQVLGVDGLGVVAGGSVGVFRRSRPRR